MPSTSPGPTPVQLFDPNDTRVLSIGLDLVALAWVGVTDLSGLATVQAPLAAQPSLQDLPLYFQAVTFQFGFTLLDRISNGNVVRLGNAAAFRDRGVFFFDERAFATVLLRPDRRWMVIGGARGQLLAQVATATTEIYDPYTDACQYGPNMSAPRCLHTMTDLDDGRWLLVGGVDGGNDPQATCELYDPATDTFTPAASMSSPRMGHTATRLPDGRVLVTGGLDAVTTTGTLGQLMAIGDAVASTEIYDPATGLWTAGVPMSTPRAAHAALLRSDGKVLLVGGVSWNPGLPPLIPFFPAVRASCDVYDPIANSVTAGPAMATPRAFVDPVQVGADRWLLAGGINGLSLTNQGNPTAAAEIYDAAANGWTSVQPMATARANHKSWALGGGRFLLAGGAVGSILSPTPLSSTEVFDVATNGFTPGPAMNAARAGAAAFRTPQGQIQLFGGSSAGNSIVNSTEWYYF